MTNLGWFWGILQFEVGQSEPELEIHPKEISGQAWGVLGEIWKTWILAWMTGHWWCKDHYFSIEKWHDPSHGAVFEYHDMTDVSMYAVLLWFLYWTLQWHGVPCIGFPASCRSLQIFFSQICVSGNCAIRKCLKHQLQTTANFVQRAQHCTSLFTGRVFHPFWLPIGEKKNRASKKGTACSSCGELFHLGIQLFHSHRSICKSGLRGSMWGWFYTVFRQSPSGPNMSLWSRYKHFLQFGIVIADARQSLSVFGSRAITCWSLDHSNLSGPYHSCLHRQHSCPWLFYCLLSQLWV